MKLKELTIKMNESYDDNPGQYRGKIKWEEKNDGEMTIVLPPEISEKLLLFLAPVMQEFSTRAATAMVNAIEASVNEARQLPEVCIV